MKIVRKVKIGLNTSTERSIRSRVYERMTHPLELCRVKHSRQMTSLIANRSMV